MSLRTVKRLRRRKWTELLTTEEFIKQVHAFAINENKSEEDDEPPLNSIFIGIKTTINPLIPSAIVCKNHYYMHPKERMKSQMKTTSVSTTTTPNPIQTKKLLSTKLMMMT